MLSDNSMDVISRVVGVDMLVPDKQYPTSLPIELAAWYCYTRDGGHSILVLLDPTLADNVDHHVIEGQLVPAPVLSVQNAGYTVVRGYICCTLPYDSVQGLLVDPSDEEF